MSSWCLVLLVSFGISHLELVSATPGILAGLDLLPRGGLVLETPLGLGRLSITNDNYNSASEKATPKADSCSPNSNFNKNLSPSGFLPFPSAPYPGLHINLNIAGKGGPPPPPSYQQGYYPDHHDCHHGSGEQHPSPPYFQNTYGAGSYPQQRPPQFPATGYPNPPYNRPVSTIPSSRPTGPGTIPTGTTESVDEGINSIFNQTTPGGSIQNPETGEGNIDVRIKPE